MRDAAIEAERRRRSSLPLARTRLDLAVAARVRERTGDRSEGGKRVRYGAAPQRGLVIPSGSTGGDQVQRGPLHVTARAGDRRVRHTPCLGRDHRGEARTGSRSTSAGAKASNAASIAGSIAAVHSRPNHSRLPSRACSARGRTAKPSQKSAGPLAPSRCGACATPRPPAQAGRRTAPRRRAPPARRRTAPAARNARCRRSRRSGPAYQARLRRRDRAPRCLRVQPVQELAHDVQRHAILGHPAVAALDLDASRWVPAGAPVDEPARRD